MSHLDELVKQLHCSVTADEYVTVEEDMTTCFTFDGLIEPMKKIGEKTYVL